MDIDVEGIIQCIRQGDENGVQTQLQEFNKEYAQCFFFDAEERDRRKFRKNKVREYADSDSDCDEYDQEDRGLILRQSLAVVLVRFIRTGVKCRLLRVCLRTLRILSRDQKVLGPLVTDSALLTLAKLAGLTTTDASDEASDPDSEFYDNVIASLAEAKVFHCRTDEDDGDVEANDQSDEYPAFEDDTKSDISIANSGDLDSISWLGSHRTSINEMHRGTVHHKEGGVSILTAALENCLEVQWKEQYECVLDPAAPPISLEASQRIIEILKILFNITHSIHRQEPSEPKLTVPREMGCTVCLNSLQDDAALYRHLVAILRLCLMRKCLLTDDTDELQGHTVNLLSALPLQCLDVLLMVPLQPNSEQCQGVNMDCVHTLLMFMERRLELILPPLKDVSHRPEEGSTVKSRLIRLMTHLDTDVKHCAADLIFVLCKENVRRFVKYTGYGNAAGLLATRGLLGGQGSRTSSSDAQYSSDSDSDTEEYRQRLIMLFNKLSRDNIIQPMGVDAEGKLVPMSGLRENSITEEGKSGSENDGEADQGEKD
eukprot:superscaffoldBa00002534_g14565